MPHILTYKQVLFVLNIILLSACADAARDTNNPNPISSVSVPSFITDTGDEHPGSVAISFIEDSTDTIDILLLAEDTDGDPITWTIATPPTKGGVVIDQGDSPGTSKTIHYTPNADARDTDSFVVSIVDGTGGGNTVTVDVSIIPPSYNVSVTVSGYTTGNTLVLQNNGGDDLSLTKDGVYEFNSPVNRATLYGVTIATPTEVIKTSCTLSNSSGTMANADITDVTVICDDNTAPKIISKAPAAGAIDVSIEPVVSVVFDEDTLLTSIGSDAIDIISSTSSVGGTANYDVQSRTLSFAPTGPLEFLKPYTIVASPNISDISGQFLAGSSWSFTTRDAAWGRAKTLPVNGVGPTGSSNIVMDRFGNGFIVWAEFDGTRSNLWTNRFDVKTNAWGDPTLMEMSELSVLRPQIVLDVVGNIFVAWQHQNALLEKELWAKVFYVSEGEWSAAEHLNVGGANPLSMAHLLSLNMLRQGLINWNYQPVGGGLQKKMSSYFDLGTKKWNTSVLDAPDSQGGIVDSGMVTKLLNQSLTLWKISNSYYANYFEKASSSWGNSELIVNDDQKTILSIQLATNAAGDGLVLWFQDDITEAGVWVRRFDHLTKEWGLAEKIDVINKRVGGISELAVKLDWNGHGLAVWRQTDDILGMHIDAEDNSLSTAEIIELPQLKFSIDLRFTMNVRGDGIAVWRQRSSASIDIWVNRFDADAKSWGVAELIETNNQGTARDPVVAIDFMKRGIAVWHQDGDTGQNLL